MTKVALPGLVPGSVHFPLFLHVSQGNGSPEFYHCNYSKPVFLHFLSKFSSEQGRQKKLKKNSLEFCILFHNVFVLIGKQGVNYLPLHQVDAPET